MCAFLRLYTGAAGPHRDKALAAGRRRSKSELSYTRAGECLLAQRAGRAHSWDVPPLRRTLKWIGLALGASVAVVLIALLLVDWNALRKPVERMASSRSGRAVSIAGALRVHLWSWTPSVTVDGLTIGNPSWERGPPLARIDRASVQLQLLPLLKGDIILPQVVLERPRVYLHRGTTGRANWTFRSTRPANAPAPAPPDFPVVRSFVINSGLLTVVDDMRKLRVEGTVQAHEKISGENTKPFRIEGKGTLNDEPFTLRVAGGPLVNLDPDSPYPFEMAIRAGNISIASTGHVIKPFDMAHVQLGIDASGDDLADLYYLTHITLPNTPPFRIKANIRRDERVVKVTDIAGTLGSSDVAGALTVDMSRKRPAVSGNLVSRRLVLTDLAASLGAKAKKAGSLDPSTTAPPGGFKRLFPDSRLQVQRVRAMDANVSFEARDIQAGSLPLKEVQLQIALDNGVLQLAPFEFTLPQGQMKGTLRVDARKDVPATQLDLRIKDIQLDQLKGRKPGAQPPLAGVMQARIVLAGSGRSVHDFMAGANGSVTGVLPRGEIRAAFAELTGINVARGLGLLLTGDQKRTDIRCGIAAFQVHKGTMEANNVVIDTKNVLMVGDGEIRLGPEELDLSIKGKPKKLRFFRLKTPVELNGHLRKPSIGIDAGHTLKQGAFATTLAVITAPLAAIAAFVDPGLAKDADCSALLAQSASPQAHPASRVARQW